MSKSSGGEANSFAYRHPVLYAAWIAVLCTAIIGSSRSAGSWRSPRHLLDRRQPPPSARAVRNGELNAKIVKVDVKNFDVYGARKMWIELRREDVDVGRDRSRRLMWDQV